MFGVKKNVYDENRAEDGKKGRQENDVPQKQIYRAWNSDVLEADGSSGLFIFIFIISPLSRLLAGV